MYQEFGNLMPPAAALQQVIIRTEKRPYKAAASLIAAHACIDLGMQRAGKGSYFKKASDFLTDIVAREYSDLSPRKIARVPVAALLHLTDLEILKAEARNRALQDSYTLRLAAAQRAQELTDESTADQSTARSKLIEFMPVLLGSRKQYQKKSGWMGRLALMREDNSPYATETFNPNWDVGICLPDQDTTLRQPTRLQVKGGSDAGKAASEAAGIRHINADDFGFRDPRPIILSCMHEFESVSLPEGMTLLHSEELDAMTDLLEAHCKEPLPESSSTDI